MHSWVTADEVARPWRPLSAAETERATALIESATRAILRRWPRTPERIESGQLSQDDVADVITWLVLPVLGGPPAPGLRTWQVTSGSESRSATAAHVIDPKDPWEFATWMVDLLDGPGSSPQGLPRGSFPRADPADQYDRLFPGAREVY